MDINQKPIDVKLKVKPVFAGVVIHNGSYEGPCRRGDRNTLSPETERAKDQQLFEEFRKEVKKNLTDLTPEANILEPVYLKELKRLETDLEEADLYLIYGGRDIEIGARTAIAKRYKKPVAMIGWGGKGDVNLLKGCSTVSYLRARNLEGYVLLDYSELKHLIFLLRIRKIIKETKVLRVTDRSSRDNLEKLKMKFGINYKDVSIGELANEMDKIVDGKTEQKKVEEIADKLIRNAQKVHMKREYIISSVNFYLAVKNLMEKYKCNAFTVGCYEICPDKRVASQRKAVPCLTHTLLKDEGIPSACEDDIDVLLSIMFLMYVSKKSVYMGNIEMINRKENVMAVRHDVAGMKMKGLTQPDSPYEIRNFTYGGWGAVIRYDFSQDNGKKVTMARFNPLGNRMMLTKGEIVGCEGFDSKLGCDLKMLIKVPDVADFFHEAANFGNHRAVVYGDYIQELRELGNSMKFEVVEI